MLATATLAGLPACGCDDSVESVLVSRREDRFYVCDPSVGIGDSLPPTCGAKPGTSGNERLRGPAVADLAAAVPNRSANVVLTRRCGDVVGVEATDVR